MALKDLVDKQKQNSNKQINNKQRGEKQEDEDEDKLSSDETLPPKACPHCSVVGEHEGGKEFHCVNDDCFVNLFCMGWTEFHIRKRDKFLATVDMVKVRDDLEDIVPDIR